MRVSLLGFLLSAVSVFVPFSSDAQFYSTGADPLGLHWLRSPADDGGAASWRIHVDSAAWRWGARASKVLERQSPLLRADFPPLSLSNRRIDVLVHSRHAYSNGLVTWAPRRLEAYAYDVGADDCVPWTTHLMTHEYRHVLQTQSSITGFSRLLHGLFGEQSTGLILGLFVPRWYLEGDAVWAETRYTDGGRGRNPDFVQQMRALCTSGRTPSFSQAYFGSYACRVPDFYKMGYTMVDEASKAFGNEVFGNAVNKAGRLPFTFFPFQRSLRQQTGMRPMRLYSWALGRARAEWEGEMSARVVTPSRPLSPPAESYREVLYFTPWGGGGVSYVSSPDFLSRFEVYDTAARLVRVITPSDRNEARFCVSGEKLVWSERRQHCRWANASESCVMEADLTSGRVARLSHGANYHSPAVSPAADRIACVRVGDDMAHSVAMLEGGVEVARPLSFPVGWQVPEVTWLDGGRLLMVVVNDEGRQIVSYDVDTGDCRLIYGPCHRMIKSLSVDGARGCVLFAMNGGPGVYSDVYSLNLASCELRREAVSLHGADCPVPSGDSIIVSLYGPDGYAPAKVGRNAGGEASKVAPARPFHIPVDTLSSCGFKRVGALAAHLKPRVHSWGPIVVDADNQTVSPGVSLASQNLLGTVMMQAGYNFAPDDDVNRLFADVTWDWLWPRLKFGGRWGHADYDYSFSYKQKRSSGVEEQVFDILMRTTDRSRLSKLTLEASLPLTRNSGAWLRAVTASASFDWERSSGIDYDVWQVPADAENPAAVRHYKLRTADSRYFASTFGLSSHLLRRAAANDVGYRWGAAFSVVYDRAVRLSDFGSMLNLNLRLYMPGFGLHHQVLLSASAQNKWPGERVESTGGYAYRRMVSDRVAAPYGLGREANRQAVLLRAAYTLPVCNPDWELGPVAYVKRICFRAIGDYGVARLWTGLKASGVSRRWTASGELWAETRLATLPYPVSVGWRGSFLPDSRRLMSSLLLSVSFK